MMTQYVDVLVCGGGMSGMSCAAFAAEAGAKVLVVEKQSQIGGSSRYSAGMFWAPRSYDDLRSWVPEGEPALQHAWMQDYLRAVQWMRDSGVPTSPKFEPIMTIGIGYPINIPHLHQLNLKRLTNNDTGSELYVNTQVVKLIQERSGVLGSRVVGAIICRNGKEYIEVRAKSVVMSTGGFQGSPELTSTHLGPGGSNIFVRSNSGSVGDGITLATSVGAGTSRGMDTYYGHLMAAPLRKDEVDPKDYLPLAQYQSKHCLLVNEQGRRFTDETLGDEVVNQHLAKQPNRRGFILFNEETRLQHCVSALFPNAGNVDRLAKARSHGCNVASADTIDGLASVLNSWGVDGAQSKRTIDQYRRRIGKGEKSAILDVPVGKVGLPPTPLSDGAGPFYAMEVQPSITFTYGGIAIDSQGRALTRDQKPIPGLLIAGVDAGGFSNSQYAGGLALAFVTGYWAARAVAKELALPIPQLPQANPQDTETREKDLISARL